MKIEISPDIQAAYDAQYTPEMTAWRELGAKYKAENILTVCQDIPRPQKVLEVGAGEGSLLMHLEKHDFAPELYALEISRSGVERITERGLASLREVKLFDGYQIPYADDTFDVVILSHVLEHVEFPRLLLRELRRVARYQVIEVPLDFAFQLDHRVAALLSYGHINIYTPALLRFLLKTEGFKVLADHGSVIAREIADYNFYVNQGQPRTLPNRLRREVRWWRKQLRRRFARPQMRDLLDDAYTVLAEKQAESLKIF